MKITWICPLCKNEETGHGYSFMEGKKVICSKCKRGVMEFDDDSPRDYYQWERDLGLEEELDW
jgi:hypothetical protein